MGKLKKRVDEAKTKSMLETRTVVNKPEPQKPARMSNIARKINLGSSEFGRENIIEGAIFFLKQVSNFNDGKQISLKRCKTEQYGMLKCAGEGKNTCIREKNGTERKAKK